jgi:yersiniabactin salicyl-AMP ligase
MKSHEAVRPDTALGNHWQPLTLGQHLSRWARIHDTRIALVDGASHCTYAELDRQAERLAAGLMRLGIRRDDVVLVQLPNSMAFAVTLFALMRVGALPLLAMPSQRLGDLEGLCAQGNPVACIMPDRFLGFDHRAMAEALQARYPGVRHLIIDGDAGRHVALKSLEDEPIEGRIEPDPHDTALLLQSGGTTGTPKLIPRTHIDYAYNFQASAALCGMDSESVYLVALPIAHNFPLACPGLLGTLSVGGRSVMARTPSSEEAFSLIAREGVTITALVPPLAQLWLQAREGDDTDLTSLRHLQVGGARLEPALARKIAPVLGCRLQQVFGMAEGLLCYTRLDDPDEVIYQTQGRPLSPLDEIRIVGADGIDVASGETGELITRGPYTIRGYHGNGTCGTESFTVDGYYRTGDLVRRTPEGNLVVEGRLKEQINRAGEKIATAEIEQHLREHPAIQDAVVVAVEDCELGERACAFIVSRGEAPSLRELHDFLRSRGLPRYKLPDQIETVMSWPLTTVGKIDKRRLAQLSRKVDETTRLTYRERHVATKQTPLALAVGIAHTLEEASFTVYERDGEWCVGIGVLAELHVDAQEVVLAFLGDSRSWPLGDFAATIGQALAALPVDDYRLYGTADFELARLFHGLVTEPTARPLLHLIAPEIEIRLRKGHAIIRTVDEATALEWAERIARLDALPPEDQQFASSGHLGMDIERADAEPYKQRVASAVSQILERDYEKVILSRAVPVDGRIDIVSSYHWGRNANQPARSFLLRRGLFSSAGFSPETLVEVAADGRVSTQPLAGTRALGANAEEEDRLRAELVSDPKEIMEHAISIRLAFDELKQVCAHDSVQVGEFMQVCRRGTVQHLGSRVHGRLDSGRTAWDAFRSLFPAVTASGIPKREAIDAIGRYEPLQRGLYSGCVLIADSDGALDAALVLRSMYQDEERAWLRAGAGIVAMSTPERELEETREKLTSVSRFLVEAGGWA